MVRKKSILVLLAIFSIAFAITTISYGYWTDELSIYGEGTFEYNLPIVNDIEMQDEELNKKLIVVMPKTITNTDSDEPEDSDEQPVSSPEANGKHITLDQSEDIIPSENENNNENTE